MPARLMPSWAAAPPSWSVAPSASDRAKSPAAGTVVTEMNTPTSAFVRPPVWDSTPAQPASTATTADQRSGPPDEARQRSRAR